MQIDLFSYRSLDIEQYGFISNDCACFGISQKTSSYIVSLDILGVIMTLVVYTAHLENNCNYSGNNSLMLIHGMLT